MCLCLADSKRRLPHSITRSAASRAELRLRRRREATNLTYVRDSGGGWCNSSFSASLQPTALHWGGYWLWSVPLVVSTASTQARYVPSTNRIGLRFLPNGKTLPSHFLNWRIVGQFFQSFGNFTKNDTTIIVASLLWQASHANGGEG